MRYARSASVASSVRVALSMYDSFDIERCPVVQRLTALAGTRNTSRAPSVTAIEMKMRPAVDLPVRSLSQPTIAGEKNPARLAKQFTAAMPAAAEMPPSNAVGRDQNCDDDARMPAAAMLRQTIDAA